MDIELYITIGVFVLLVATLVITRVKAVYAFSVAGFILILSRVITVDQFIRSFANSSILSIFLLIFIAGVIRENFNLVGWLGRMYSNTHHPRWFLFKNSLGVSLLSSVMNNTPIVALMIPHSYHWAEKNKVNVSKLLLPLSFAAITGGMITVIGTSTNLVLNGFLEANGQPLLTWEDFIIPGLMVTVVSAIYAATIGYRLLPDSSGLRIEDSKAVKNYLMECLVKGDGLKGDQTVLSAGFRNLDGVFLAEIIRGDQVISPVTPDTFIQQGDRLFFAGDHNSVTKLVEEKEFLSWSKLDEFRLMDHQGLLETVIPYNSGLVNRTLKESDFRSKFNAVVIGIHRNGEQLTGKLGEVRLKPGDLLIVASGKGSIRKINNLKDLYIVNKIKGANNGTGSNSKTKFIGIGIVGTALLLGAGLGLFVSLLFLLGLAFALKLTNSQKIKNEFNLELLLILGSAIAIGTAMIENGVGDLVVDGIRGILPQLNGLWLLGFIFIMTILLTSFVTNVAAVSIMYPVAFSFLEVIPVPSSVVFLTIAFGASAAFLTPVSYQTNLMVQGPGGYTQKDFFKYGTPMLLLYAGVFAMYILFKY